MTDPRRVGSALAASTRLSDEDARRVLVRSSLPAVVEPERCASVDWQLAFFIPFEVLERHVGALGPLGRQPWRANLYKCGDKTSHPHWASWAPLDARNFHLPQCFGTLDFEAPPAADARSVESA